MANMAHCRFENTVGDMEDCINVLQMYGSIEATRNDVNQYERRFIRRFVQMCVDVADEFGDELNENDSITTNDSKQ